jgi:large subunit ribosomal protein L6
MVQQKQEKMEEIIFIPEGVEATIEEKKLSLKGPSGTVEKLFANPLIMLTKKDNTISLSAPSTVRNYKKMLFTYRAHINNMVKGTQEKFVYTLKICSGHFPMTVKVEEDKIIITNFLGEKIPRISKILPNVEVKVDKDIITVTSPDREAAGQTAANLEKATHITNRDRRVFQDGCYIIEKPGKKFI